MNVILISGKAEAGKTTTAKIIKEYLELNGEKVVIAPYGQYVKDTAKMVWDWNGQKDEQGRMLLQWWGTNYIRNKDPNFWLDTVTRLVHVLEDLVDYVIIDDCRFRNEIVPWYDGLNRVHTIRVERPHHENSLTPEQRQHPSETDLDDWKSWDHVLSADDYDQLYIVAQAAAHKIYRNF